MSTDADTVDKQPELKRVMGPGLLLLFVVGDILGTGVYALTGDVAAEVGGAAWIPFLVAFLIATVTAFSYLELVTKYPQAAGAALYAHKAFGVQFVTFLIAFVVMCSGITSASTASRFFAANFFTAFHFSWGTAGVVVVALVLHAATGPGEPAWCGRECQAQRRSDHHRDHRSDAGDHGGSVRLHQWRRRRLLPRRRVRHRQRQALVHGRHRRDIAGVLRHGRLRGLGEHGRGDQGSGEDLSEDPVDWSGDRRHGLCRRRRSSPSRWFRSARWRRAKPRSSRWSRPVRPGCRSKTSCRSSRCSRCPTPR